jgi:hypothetical protein
MKSGQEINRISGDGYLVLPLSVSRLAAGQSPEEVYEIFGYFAPKLEVFANDVVLLYTNGIYFNSEEISFERRKKLNQQILNHATALRSLIFKKKQYIPGAFHFLPVDYVILNSPQFGEYFGLLKKREADDKEFRFAIQQDMGEREYNEANTNFILEEVAIAHIIRQRLVEFPRTLVRNDIWRLLCYPGGPILSDAYQWQNNILPRPDTINPYNSGQYNYTSKQLYDYNFFSNKNSLIR